MNRWKLAFDLGKVSRSDSHSLSGNWACAITGTAGDAGRELDFDPECLCRFNFDSSSRGIARGGGFLFPAKKMRISVPDVDKSTNSAFRLAA
jgi:hypothetical protein